MYNFPSLAFSLTGGDGKSATGMNKMMMVASDTSFDDGGKPGQVGGYGVGCKVGIIAAAHTGVILTLGTTSVSGGRQIKTVSIGLISNEPFEKHGGDPIVQHVYVACFVTNIRAKEDTLLACTSSFVTNICAKEDALLAYTS
jgi:hypothetical protein